MFFFLLLLVLIVCVIFFLIVRMAMTTTLFAIIHRNDSFSKVTIAYMECNEEILLIRCMVTHCIRINIFEMLRFFSGWDISNIVVDNGVVC